MFAENLIEKFTEFPTPFFYYDLEVLQKSLDSIKAHGLSKGYHVHYALKANYNDKILKNILQAGLGADCVSGNEVRKAIEVGFDPASIAFAGVGKSDAEITYALNQNIYNFNVESAQELEVINELAGAVGKHTNIALRINPNVKADTHHYITTGVEENKFGINLWDFDEIGQKMHTYTNLKLIGIHFHIGSQLTNHAAFRALCEEVNELQEYFEGRNVELRRINVGGGLGINYADPDGAAVPDFEGY